MKYNTNKINVNLDLIVKTISILSIINIIVGIYIFYEHLNLSNTVFRISYITDSKILIFSSAFVLFSALIIYLIMYSIPYIFTQINDRLHFSVVKKNKKQMYLNITIIYILFLVILTIGSNYKHDNFLFYLCFIEFLLLVFSFIYYFFYISFKFFDIKNILFINLAFIYILFFVLIISLFVIKISNNISNAYVIYISCFSLFLYSVGAGIASYNRNNFNSCIITLYFTSFILFCFSDTLITKTIHTLGIGNYQTTFILDQKISKQLIETNGYKHNAIKIKDSLIFKDLWVIASLSDKFIISDSKKCQNIYIIPKSSVLLERIENKKERMSDKDSKNKSK